MITNDSGVLAVQGFQQNFKNEKQPYMNSIDAIPESDTKINYLDEYTVKK